MLVIIVKCNLKNFLMIRQDFFHIFEENTSVTFQISLSHQINGIWGARIGNTLIFKYHFVFGQIVLVLQNYFADRV
jgi:hypothetical protein